MTSVIICSAAEVDFTESLKWYAERGIEAANDFDAEFDRAIFQIAADPERFPMCDARHRYFLLRRFPFRIMRTRRRIQPSKDDQICLRQSSAKYPIHPRR